MRASRHLLSGASSPRSFRPIGSTLRRTCGLLRPWGPPTSLWHCWPSSAGSQACSCSRECRRAFGEVLQPLASGHRCHRCHHFWQEGSLSLWWGHERVFSRVYGVGSRGHRCILVTAVTLMTLMTVVCGCFLDRGATPQRAERTPLRGLFFVHLSSCPGWHCKCPSARLTSQNTYSTHSGLRSRELSHGRDCPLNTRTGEHVGIVYRHRGPCE